VWGGDPACEHEWGELLPVAGKVTHGLGASTLTGGHDSWANRNGASQGSFCPRCGAWRGCLGLEPTPELYVQHLVEIFREVWRVLRDDGTLWLVIGDSYVANSQGQAHGQSFGKERQNDPGRSGGVIYQPNAEARHHGLKPKDLVGIPWRAAFALQADGWYLRSDIIWAKPNPMPESVTDRPTKAHEYIFLLAKSRCYFYDQDATREPHQGDSGWSKQRERGDLRYSKKYGKRWSPELSSDHAMLDHPSGRNRRSVWTIPTESYTGSHFATFPTALVEPCIKAATSEHGVCPRCGAPWKRMVKRATRFEGGSGKAGRTAEEIGGKWSDDRHGKNILLGPVVDVETTGWRPTCTCGLEDVIPALVLDPFIGSGTTCAVAQRLGRRSIGLDLSATYMNLALERTGLLILQAWHEGSAPVADDFSDLPLLSNTQYPISNI